MPERRIYISENFMDTQLKLFKILKTENRSFSDWVRTQIAEYVRLHEPGNPQQTWDTINKIGHAYHAETCQRCKRKPIRYGLKNGIWLGFCGEHWEVRKFQTWK